MASTSVAATHCYRFQVLRYVPNLVSGEYFNIGLLLRDGENQLIDARFAADFRRLRCHPLAELDYLEALRNEFEEKRLLEATYTLPRTGKVSASCAVTRSGNGWVSVGSW